MEDRVYQQPAAEALTARDYERVFGVLEDVSAAETIEVFRSRLVHSLSERFRIQHVTYFRGPSLSEAFDDPDPFAGSDIGLGGLREYRDRWRLYDIFATDNSLDRLHRAGVVSLEQIGRPSGRARAYVEGFLRRRCGLNTCAAFTFRAAAGGAVVIGLFDSRQDALAPGDLAAIRLLRRHLPVVARAVPARAGSAAAPPMTVRQRELADLVALGLTNAEIGRRLCLTEDTVKKYVGRLLRRTGCASRTELAVRASTWT
jgi:DNA-binding NarL/FixJ family response regulator